VPVSADLLDLARRQDHLASSEHVGKELHTSLRKEKKSKLPTDLGGAVGEAYLLAAVPAMHLDLAVWELVQLRAVGLRDVHRLRDDGEMTRDDGEVRVSMLRWVR